jgi:hypothetical protein
VIFEPRGSAREWCGIIQSRVLGFAKPSVIHLRWSAEWYGHWYGAVPTLTQRLDRLQADRQRGSRGVIDRDGSRPL